LIHKLNDVLKEELPLESPPVRLVPLTANFWLIEGSGVGKPRHRGVLVRSLLLWVSWGLVAILLTFPLPRSQIAISEPKGLLIYNPTAELDWGLKEEIERVAVERGQPRWLVVGSMRMEYGAPLQAWFDAFSGMKAVGPHGLGVALGKKIHCELQGDLAMGELPSLFASRARPDGGAPLEIISFEGSRDLEIVLYHRSTHSLVCTELLMAGRAAGKLHCPLALGSDPTGVRYAAIEVKALTVERIVAARGSVVTGTEEEVHEWMQDAFSAVIGASTPRDGGVIGAAGHSIERVDSPQSSATLRSE